MGYKGMADKEIGIRGLVIGDLGMGIKGKG